MPHDADDPRARGWFGMSRSTNGPHGGPLPHAAIFGAVIDMPRLLHPEAA